MSPLAAALCLRLSARPCTPQHKDAVEILRGFIDNGAEVDSTDIHGRTALFWCALLGNAEGARALLIAGANPAHGDENGWLPLDIARVLRHHDVAEVILSSGKELKQLPEGSLFWAATTKNEAEGLAVVEAALAAGSSLEQLEEVNVCGRTAMHYAAMHGRTRVLKALIGAGAPVHVRDASGRTPAAWAAVTGHVDALRLILHSTQGKDEPEDLEQAAVLAARNGNAHAVRLLVLGPAGVDPAPLFRSTRRANVALIAALEPAELCRAVVLNARRVHPLVTLLEGSHALEQMHLQERSRDAQSAANMLAAAKLLEKLACSMVRTGASRGALLDTKLVPDGRTSIELAVDAKRKVFVSMPPVQQYVDKLWYQGGVVYHATRKAGRVYYVLTGIAMFALSPLLLALSYVSSTFAVDIDIVFAPLERYAAKEVFFLAFMITVQFLKRVEWDPRNADEPSAAFEIFLGLWMLGIWVGELQHLAAARRAEKQRKSLLAELWEVASGGWTGFDFVVVSYGVAVAAVRLSAHFEPELAGVEQDMRAMGYLVLWLRLLHVLSVFSFTGPLVQMIIQMFLHDLVRWMFVQVLVLVSFASALSALFSGLEVEEGDELAHFATIAFGSIGKAMKTLSEITIGDDEPYPARTWELVAGSSLGWAILAAYSVLTSLLLINMLIGLLAHTVESIRNRNIVEYTWGRAQTALEARTLPIIPAPLNLVHVAFQFLGALLSPLLRACGALPPTQRVAEERLASRTARMHLRQRSLVGHAASAVKSTAGVVAGAAGLVWGAVVGDSHVGAERIYWQRPAPSEIRRIFHAAWEDLQSEEQSESTAAQLERLHTEVAEVKAAVASRDPHPTKHQHSASTFA